MARPKKNKTTSNPQGEKPLVDSPIPSEKESGTPIVEPEIEVKTQNPIQEDCPDIQTNDVIPTDPILDEIIESDSIIDPQPSVGTDVPQEEEATQIDPEKVKDQTNVNEIDMDQSNQTPGIIPDNGNDDHQNDEDEVDPLANHATGTDQIGSGGDSTDDKGDENTDSENDDELLAIVLRGFELNGLNYKPLKKYHFSKEVVSELIENKTIKLICKHG